MATNTEVGVKITVDGSDAVQSVGSIKKQLREATADLIAMRQKFGDTSKEAVQAAKRVANLKDEIGDAKAFTDAFNPDAKFKAFGAAIQGVAGGFAAVQGAQALFGNESKELEKTLLKVQGAMALSQGLNSVLEARDSFKNLATFVKGGLSNAFGSLRQAIISTGIGALVVAVGLLIANFDKVKKVVLNFVPGLAAVGDTIMGIVNAVTDFLGVTSEAQRQTDKLIDETEKKIKKTETFLDANADKYDEFTQRKIKANLEYQKKVVEVNKNEELSEAEKQSILNQYREKATREIKKAGDDRQKLIDDAAKKELEKSQEARKKREEKAEEERKKKLAQEEELRKKLAEQQQISDDFVIQKRLQSFKNEFDKRQFELSVQNQKEIDKQIEFLNQKLITEQEYQNRKAIIDADFVAKQAELEAERKSTQEEKDAEDKANKDKAAAEERQRLIDAEKAAAEERVRVAQIEAQRKEEIQNSYVQTFGAAIGLIRSLGEKNKAVQKVALIAENAVTVAKIILDAQKSIASAAASAALVPPLLPPGVPNPAWFAAKAYAAKQIAFAKVNAGIGIATSIAATAKGLSQLGGGSAGGGGGTAGGGASLPEAPSAPLQPQAQTTLLNQAQVNQIGNVAARAYVVESDVSGNQQRIQRLERAARIA
jgi:hypothetical protein